MYTGERSNSEFPGFIDVGCGNGILVCVLIQEGYQGRGLDCRRRKSWDSFPANVQSKLEEQLLVPKLLQRIARPGEENAIKDTDNTVFHNGLFTPGTFIISNHADELTAWTPLLAYLNESPFIAIPCCSHNLAGTRTRFGSFRDNPLRKPENGSGPPSLSSIDLGPGPATGSLATHPPQRKQPSAYAGLTRYVEEMAREVGYEAEKEVLRIPSTRNTAIVGRQRTRPYGELEERDIAVKRIVEREVGALEQVAGKWIERVTKIADTKGNCH